MPVQDAEPVPQGLQLLMRAGEVLGGVRDVRCAAWRTRVLVGLIHWGKLRSQSHSTRWRRCQVREASGFGQELVFINDRCNFQGPAWHAPVDANYAAFAVHVNAIRGSDFRRKNESE